MLLIPAIDLRDGNCVRLHQGDFGTETRYTATPRQLVEHYQALGAPWVHVVDLDGARDGAQRNRKVILQLAAAAGSIRLQVGGGVRSIETLSELFDSGVARIVVGSAALERAGEVVGWLKLFGPERICLAFDIRVDNFGQPRVCTRGWAKQSTLTLWDALDQYPAGGVRHVLCTDIKRDGALTGPNLELYEGALKRFPNLEWQASGGVRNARDLTALGWIGVTATVVGKALLEERITVKELQSYLRNASSLVSMYAPARW